MNFTRLKHLMLLAAGLLAAGPASAATLTVHSTMSGAQVASNDPNGFFAVGKVTGSSPSTINCPTNYTAIAANGVCADPAATGTVTLTASSTQNAAFVAWSGGCTTAVADVCTVDASTAKDVTAVFKPMYYPVQLSTYGSTGNPGYLTTDVAITAPAADCKLDPLTALPVAGHPTCLVAAANGLNVIVTAVPGAGFKVVNWTGCAVTTATTCTVALTSPKGVSATFGPLGIPVTVQKANFGATGTVTAAVAGNVIDAISCGADCFGQVNPGGNITLTAAAGANSKFVGFTGCTTSTATTCTITSVTTPKTVTATFKGASCSSCHGTPPADHITQGFATAGTNCGTCHGAKYGASTVDPTVHMTGSVNIAGPKTAIPASFGTVITVTGANVISATNVVTVDVKITDVAGTPVNIKAEVGLGQQGTFGSGAASGTASGIPRFAVGQVQADGSFKTVLGSSTLTTSETGSTAASWTDMGSGVYRYTLTARAAQSGKDTTKLFRAVVYGARYYKWADGTSIQVPDASAPFDFPPDGVSATGAFTETVTKEACNACHAQLTLHGRRREVATCLTCHNINTPLGSGNTDTYKWDLKNLVHKFHSGINYGAVGVNAIKPDGSQGNPWGTTLDATGVLMAPSHSMYFEGGNSLTDSAGAAIAVIDPELVSDCTICHTGANAGNAYSKPTRAACGSCHDQVNFATGAGHDGTLAQPDDTLCSNCHPASGTNPFAVANVHGPFYEPAHKVNFAALSGFPAGGHKFKVNLVDVTSATNGMPTFTVDVSLDNLPFDIKGVLATPSVTVGRVATCAFQIAGPTTDYVVPATGGTAQSCTAAAGWTFVSSTATSSRFTFSSGTFFAGKPTGYYTAAFEIMWQRVTTASNGDFVKKPFSANPNFLTLKVDTGNAVTVATGAEETLNKRRNVVSFDKCNACHVDIGFHSNRGRKGPDYCATCHNPKLDNGTRARVTVAKTGIIPGSAGVNGYLPESVSLNVFIHRIHMGGDLPSVVSGNTASVWVPFPGEIAYGATRSNVTGASPTVAPSISDFSKFAMPSDMGRCDSCHIGEMDPNKPQVTKTWALNEGPGLAPIERTWKVCNPVTPSWATEPWCDATSASSGGMPKYTGPGAVVVTPPLKAVCTSCHDSAVTDTHADLNTVNPMTAGASELCASCHGAGKTWDALVVHERIP